MTSSFNGVRVIIYNPGVYAPQLWKARIQNARARLIKSRRAGRSHRTGGRFGLDGGMVAGEWVRPQRNTDMMVDLSERFVSRANKPRGSRLARHPLPPRIALRIKQRGEIAMIDPCARRRRRPAWRGRRRRARPPRSSDVVRAVADRQRRRERQPERRRPRRATSRASSPRRRSAGRRCPQLAVRHVQPVRERAVEADLGRHAIREHGEAARDEHAPAPCALIVAISAFAPAMITTRSAWQRSIMLASRSRSSATRASSAASKSSSPRIAASVTAAICGLIPA